MEHELDNSLFYHLPFKEFLDKGVFGQKLGKFWNLESLVSIFYPIHCEVTKFVDSKEYSLSSYAIELIGNVHCSYLNKRYYKLLAFFIYFLKFVKDKSF